MSDDLVKRLRTDAEAYRQSLAAPTSHDMFTLAYQWQDKKHRHVWDLCSRLETAANRIEELEAALRSVPKIVEFGFEHYKGCVDIKITREVKLFVQKALGEKDE